MNKFLVRAIGVTLIWCLISPGKLMGCIWLRGTTIEGKYTNGRSDYSQSMQLRDVTDATPAERMRTILLSRDPSSTESSQRNDAAVEILLQGDAKSAVEQLEAIEKSHPGDYYTAANLGTAYELSGNDEKALQWIREGIKRDPDAHMTTEWLHARILEAKIALKSNPTWLENNTITGVEFTRLKEPGYKLATLQGNLGAAELHRSLWTQLSVRMLFVKPKDAIVAQLLYELALVEAQTKFLEDAKVYVKTAEAYGFPPSKTESLVKVWERTIWWSGLKHNFLWTLFRLALVFVPLWTLDAIRKSRRRAAA